METKPSLDQAAAHRYFAVECFNRAWDLMDKPQRTAEEDEEMLRLSLSSHWHWTQREDCEPSNRSAAYWQSSRIYALLGRADGARRHGQFSLDWSQEEGVLPFYVGYAYEALARAELVAGNRAELVAGNRAKMEEYLAAARRVSESIVDPEAKQMLLADLETIR